MIILCAVLAENLNGDQGIWNCIQTDIVTILNQEQAKFTREERMEIRNGSSPNALKNASSGKEQMNAE